MDIRDNQAEGIKPSADEELARLLRSKTIREVFARQLAPQTLDKHINRLKKDNKELKNMHMLDQSEIVRLRRQIEFLIGHDNTEV